MRKRSERKTASKTIHFWLMLELHSLPFDITNFLSIHVDRYARNFTSFPKHRSKRCVLFLERNRKSNDSRHVIHSLTVQFKCIERFDVFCNVEETTEWIESEKRKGCSKTNLERHLFIFSHFFRYRYRWCCVCLCVIWNIITPKKGILC